jgi:hypothetical protein
MIGTCCLIFDHLEDSSKAFEASTIRLSATAIKQQKNAVSSGFAPHQVDVSKQHVCQKWIFC